MKRNDFVFGLRDGIPIGVGYLSVSFGFGITAVRAGLNILQTVFISATNVTSAGQVAGLTVIVAGGTLIEMILCQLIINCRYSLMGIMLTQKMDSEFPLWKRLAFAFMITDEIFAVSIQKPGNLSPRYTLGLSILPYLGWTGGTLLGAVAGNVLPQSVAAALGMAIYGMFIAICVPEAKKHGGVLLTVLLAVAFSVIIFYVPVLSFIPDGFRIIISGSLAALITAYVCPKEDEA